MLKRCGHQPKAVKDDNEEREEGTSSLGSFSRGFADGRNSDNNDGYHFGSNGNNGSQPVSSEEVT